MKEAYRAVLKRILCQWIGTTRVSCDMTQTEMAEELLIDVRSYADIDRGVSLCGTLTLVLFLVYSCKEPTALLSEIRTAFDEVRRHDA